MVGSCNQTPPNGFSKASSKAGVDVQPSYYQVLNHRLWVYLYFSASYGETISWNFTSTGQPIEVLACNSSEFSAGPTTNYYTELATPSYGRSGTFDVPYADTWYIVFWNNNGYGTAEFDV